MKNRTARIDVEDDMLKHIHGSARALLKVGAIDQVTMRDYDKLCIPRIPRIDSKTIIQIRKQSNTSQALFAQYLNTSPSTVRQWESGDKSPSGMALKLLAIVRKHGLTILA